MNDRLLKNNKSIKRGSVVLVKNEKNFSGHKQSGSRPAVVIQNNTGNLHSPTLIVAYCTKGDKRLDLPVHTYICARGEMSHDSTVLLEQIETIDKSQVITVLAQLDDYEMSLVDESLLASLGIK